MTKITMRLAKASQEDIDNAMKFLSYLEAINAGIFPLNKEDSEDDENEDFDLDDKEHLFRFYETCMDFLNNRPSGLMRVVWGFAVAADNNMFDPNKDYLDFNPALLKED